MELVKNRLASFAIFHPNVNGVVLNAKLKTKMGVVMGKYALNLKESMKVKDGTHGCILCLPRFQNSNDLYQ